MINIDYKERLKTFDGNCGCESCSEISEIFYKALERQEFIEVEKMSDEFTKYHLKGFPIDMVVHHFTGVDKGSPHDHPFGFTSHIIKGGYRERVFHINPDGGWSSELIYRRAGTVHTIEAGHIHQIVELLEEECWTLILPQIKSQESAFWRFDEIGYESSYEGDFQ